MLPFGSSDQPQIYTALFFILGKTKSDITGHFILPINTQNVFHSKTISTLTETKKNR